jgi:Helitron helicase-like domain at N-terminus
MPSLALSIIKVANYVVDSKFHKLVLVSLTPELIASVAMHLECEGAYTDLTPSQRDALELLKHVNTVAAHIPGSQASKIFVCNEIRSYIGYFGLPHIYITMNPSPTHSPLFQVFCGDQEVDLSSRFPILPTSDRRVLNLALDPVAATDFFHFSMNVFLQHLLGWDFKSKNSSERGGLFGHLKAYYGTTDYTERGSLHGHFVMWLDGRLNPAQLHEKVANDTDFERRFFAFFDQIIHHHLPDVEFSVDPGFEPRTQRLPHLDIDDWDNVFVSEVKVCGEVLQRHVGKPVCHKYNVGCIQDPAPKIKLNMFNRLCFILCLSQIVPL